MPGDGTGIAASIDGLWGDKLPALSFLSRNEHNANRAALPSGAPAAASTSYGTVNTLNQYPTVAGSTLSYDTRGNLTTDPTNPLGATTFAYDPENRIGIRS